MGKRVKKKKNSQKKRTASNQRPQSARPAEARNTPAGARPKPAQPASRPSQSAGQRTSRSTAGMNQPGRNNDKMSKQQRRKTNKAYNQATVHRSKKGRRRGSRGGNYIMYYILAAVIVLIVLIILANTVLFNCTSIEVEGNSRYTAEQIIAPSGLEPGQNLLLIDTAAAEQRISAAFSYIDMTEVKRVFPTKIKITVQEAEKWYQVRANGVTASISRMGRIVELGEDSSLPMVEGYDPAELTAGLTLSSNDSGKSDIPALILEKSEQYDIEDITRIDLTDRFDISIDCGDNITLELGGTSDIDSKLAVAAGTIKQEKANVVINLHSPSRIFVRDKVNEQAQQTLPSLSGTAEGTAESTQESTAEAD